jgi:hypothetical protein
MKLVAIKMKPSAKADRLRYERRDGSRVEIDLPRQGILPHDLVHAVVERGFGLAKGFMGVVARGRSPDFLASRTIEKTAPVQIAESMVEALQTQLALGHFDYDAFVYGVATACDARGLAPPPLPSAAQAHALFDEARAMHERWRAVPVTGSMALEFPERFD